MQDDINVNSDWWPSGTSVTKWVYGGIYIENSIFGKAFLTHGRTCKYFRRLSSRCSDFFVAFSTYALGIEVELFGIFHALCLNQNQIITIKIITCLTRDWKCLLMHLEIDYEKRTVEKKRIIKLLENWSALFNLISLYKSLCYNPATNLKFPC